MSDRKLRVWWIPQVPMKAFHVPVASVQEGKKIMAVLAKYDLFQYENKVKPDFSNAGGIQEELPDEGWCDIEDEEMEDENV